MHKPSTSFLKREFEKPHKKTKTGLNATQTPLCLFTRPRPAHVSGIRQSAARTHAKQVNNLRGRYVKIFIVTSSELTSYKQTECLRFRSSPKKKKNE